MRQNIRSIFWQIFPQSKTQPGHVKIETLLLLFCCCVLLFRTTLQDYSSGTAARLASLLFTVSWSLLKFMCIESVMPSNHLPSNHLIFCHPLLLPSTFPSIRGFSNKSALHIRWPKYWSFGFSISPSSEYSGFPLGLTGLFSPIFCTYL